MSLATGGLLVLVLTLLGAVAIWSRTLQRLPSATSLRPVWVGVEPADVASGQALAMPRADAIGCGPEGIPPDDWDLLFDAVGVTLLRSVRDSTEPAVRTTVADCVQSLALLRSALGHERDRLRHTEVQLQETAAALGAAPVPPSALAVLFLDLDDFKLVNDRHGHDTGDALLRIVAQRLSRVLREGDVVCRLGGDGFACLLSNAMGSAQLSRLATQMFDAVSAPLKVGTLALSVRPSIGIAVFPTDGNTTNLLLQRADSAMVHAKRQQLGYAFAASMAGAEAAS